MKSNSATYEDVFLTPRELARRHQRSEKSLAHDRMAGRGVPFARFGRLCRYAFCDVLDYEERQRRLSTSDSGRSFLIANPSTRDELA